jgi:hypothetical protein
LLVVGCLAFGLALAAPSDATTRTAVGLVAWLTFAALGLIFLAWRGILTAEGPASSYAFVLHDHLGQLILPMLDALAPGPQGAAAAAALLAHAVDGILDNLPLLVGLAAWGAARIVEAIAARKSAPGAPSAPPGTTWDLAVGLATLTALAARLVAPGASATSWLTFVALTLLALHVVAGLTLVRATLRSWTMAPAIVATLSAVALFLGPVALALAALGLVERQGRLSARLARPRLPSRLARASRAGATGLLSAVIVLAGLGALSDRAVLRATPSEAGGLALCRDVRTSRLPDGRGVVYRVPGLTPFRIDTHEHAPTLSEGDHLTGALAERACRAEGGRLCTSNEWYVACACGHASTLTSDLAWWRPRRVFIDEALVARARRDCQRTRPGDALGTGETCRSDHGVADLLGGSSEVLADRIAGGAHLLAGRNSTLEEDWMTKCEYRAMMTDASLRGHDWRFVGFRCCADATEEFNP